MSDIDKVIGILHDAEVKLEEVFGRPMRLSMCVWDAVPEKETPEQRIISVCCETLGITIADFKSKNQERVLSDARIIISHLLVARCKTIHSHAARITNNCNRSTLTNRLKTYADLIESDSTFRDKVKACEIALQTEEN